MKNEVQTRRLTSGDRELARRLFTLMAEVFEEEHEGLSDGYLEHLLDREDFWAIAAFSGDEGIVGGLTAHTLPMTREERAEVFVYDVAVRADAQRQGVGRKLMTLLREAAASEGLGDVLLGADNDDTHALEFYRALGGLASPVTFFTFSRGARAADGASTPRELA